MSQGSTLQRQCFSCLYFSQPWNVSGSTRGFRHFFISEMNDGQVNVAWLDIL